MPMGLQEKAQHRKELLEENQNITKYLQDEPEIDYNNRSGLIAKAKIRLSQKQKKPLESSDENKEIIEERTVGPSLGQDSIKKGQYSAMIGMLIVILFMAFYYRMSGVIADMALLLNIIFILAVLAGAGFVLTLPGVARIILTIGMAVDANVLIFERIREELRTGKTVRAAIDAGYGRAFQTILDANITTLLTALVLYQFGTGAIKGFAVTLIIGIIASMFTAIVVTRVIFDFITSRFSIKKLSI